MATIPQYTARKLLDPDRVPNSRLISYESEALGNVGSALEQLGGTLVQRQQQREAFKVENDYRKLQLDMSQQMADYEANNMPEGGIGFHDGFLKDVFQPRRDEFLKNVPPRLREKFETLLADETGADFGEWSNRAATKERDENYRWSAEQIKFTQDQLANSIALNPEQYDSILKSGKDLISSSTLPAATKRELEKTWETVAQVAHLNRLLEDDPEGVLKALGANPNLLSPVTKFDILSRSVQWQETRDNPNQISPAGAVGSHQVMPATAKLIAKRMGDPDFPKTDDPRVISEYLLRGGVSKKYGEYHLKWLMKRYPNDLEAVLIGYHSGEGAADEWLKNGRNDEVLGPAGRKYYKEVIARLPGGYEPDVPTGGAPAAGSAGSVRMLWVRDGEPIEMGPGNAQFERLNPDLVDRLRSGFAAAGMAEIRIRSGHRDSTHNARVGGARQSQHLTGSAVDIDVSGMSHADRVRLIEGLSAAGITGLGIGANTIHADVGGRRAWGYFKDGSSGAPIPKWAQGVVADHLNSTAKPTTPMTMASRYATLPYDKRQQFISAADSALTARVNEAAKVSAADKVLVQQAQENELALIRSTGAGSNEFDETRIASVLGEDDYLRYVARKQEAHRMFTALQGMKEMDPQQLQDRIEDYTPNPRSPTFASEQAIHAAVVKEAERVTRQRAAHPDKAALEFPEVKEAQARVEQGIAAGKPVAADVQDFVQAMIRKQKEFGVKTDAIAPVPSEWAFQIGQSLTRVPEPSKKVSREDIRAAIAVQYAALHEMFGDYTDEVIIYALSEYKGISENNAKYIESLMRQIAVGGDPFKPRDVADVEQVESAADPGWLRSVPGVGGMPWVDDADGAEPADEAAIPNPVEPEAEPSSEVLLRVVGRLNGVDTPEEEALLVEEYGQRAVDAAKLMIERGRRD